MLGSCSWSELRAFPMPGRDALSGPTVENVFIGFDVEVYAKRRRKNGFCVRVVTRSMGAFWGGKIAIVKMC